MSTTIVQPKPTEKFRKSFGGSIKSILNSGGRTYFILEHKSTSEKHKAGEVTEFIGDYVELGRGTTYAVNFGNDCSTVSRPHAAIIRTGDSWVLQHLSKSNQTLLNNKSIADKQPLNNGDEIQLSTMGPKISFLIPNNNKVSTMGMTVRMKALVNEAIKPYKKTISTISIVFIACITGLIFYINQQSVDTKVLLDNMAKNSQAIEKNFRDSLNIVNEKNKDFKKQLSRLTSKLEKMRYNSSAPSSSFSSSSDSAGHTAAGPLQSLYPNVYYILSDKIVIKTKDGEKTADYKISGTGFLLANGDFVTARHVIEPWMYGKSDDDKLLNIVASNGVEVVHYFTAYSPNGTQISLKSSDFRSDKSKDQSETIKDEEGNTFVFTRTSLRDGSDWGAYRTSSQNGLLFDKAMSSSLPAATTLYVLGYPLGLGAENLSNIRPVYSKCEVSRDGLDKGVIDISSRGFDQGNSGGPVFAINNQQQFVVVGIVSAELAQQGFIVPISSLQ